MHFSEIYTSLPIGNNAEVMFSQTTFRVLFCFALFFNGTNSCALQNERENKLSVSACRDPDTIKWQKTLRFIHSRQGERGTTHIKHIPTYATSFPAAAAALTPHLFQSTKARFVRHTPVVPAVEKKWRRKVSFFPSPKRLNLCKCCDRIHALHPLYCEKDEEAS